MIACLIHVYDGFLGKISVKLSFTQEQKMASCMDLLFQASFHRLSFGPDYRLFSALFYWNKGDILTLL